MPPGTERVCQNRLQEDHVSDTEGRKAITDFTNCTLSLSNRVWKRERMTKWECDHVGRMIHPPKICDELRCNCSLVSKYRPSHTLEQERNPASTHHRYMYPPDKNRPKLMTHVSATKSRKVAMKCPAANRLRK